MILWIWEYFPTKFLDLPVILKFVYVPTPLLSSARLQSTEFNSALLKQGASKVRLFPRPLQIFRPSCSPLYMYRHPANFSPSTEHKIQLHCWNRVLLKSGCSLGPFRFLDLPTALCICTDAPAQFSPSSEHRNSTPLLKQGASKVRLFPTFLQGKVPKATVSLMMPMVRAEVARSVAVPGTLSMIYRNHWKYKISIK